MRILGISCYYHDAAAALIVDGKVVAAAEEERFSRKKHDSGFPEKAIEFCLKAGGVRAEDLNWVVFYEKPFLKFERITLSALSTVPEGRRSFVDAYRVWLADKLWIRETLRKRLKVPASKVLFVQHHLAHAAASYYPSGFESAAVLTCDGVGEWTTTGWGRGKGNKVGLEYELRFPHSLGLFYSAFTQYLGFQINEGEFKVMGLAPYGQPRFVEKIEKMIHQSVDGAFQLDMSFFNFHKSETVSFSDKLVRWLGVPPVPAEKSDVVVPVYADIAASAQKVLEERLLVIAKQVKRQTGEDNLCYAGGVALNGVANWRIFKEAGFKNIFIQPAAGDSGGALGAALYVYHHVLGKPRAFKLAHAYFGEENKEGEVKSFLEREGIKARRLAEDELEEAVVEMLLKKKVVGWVKGRFEWGPRALGARSILADPRERKMKDLVNAKIKFREAFRPFAPVVLDERGADVFEVGKDGQRQQPLRYMIAVVPVKKKWQRSLGAITHVDGTARPQFIEKAVNRAYYNVVKKFGEATGVPVLLNTSFNLKGEPIVNTAAEAYCTFARSGIDALVVENYLIRK